MRILFFTVLFFMIFCSGCSLIENQLADLSGWDLSACWDGFGVCSELFFDNADQIMGGFDGTLPTQ